MFEFLGLGRQEAGGLEWGTVGWEGEEEYAFRGEGEDDGYTLVRVQLFRGRRSNALHPTDGQGHQLICHITSGVTRIPKKGARVLVATPKGMESVMGGSCIVAVVEPTPHDQLQTDRVVMDFGPDTHVVIKGKSVSIGDYSNRFITVGTPRAGGDASIMIQAENGTGMAIKGSAIAMWISAGGDAKNMFQMDASQTQCMVKSGGYWSVDASGFTATGSSCYIRGGFTYLGGGVTPFAGGPGVSNAHYGPAGPGAPSNTVFIAP